MVVSCSLVPVSPRRDWEKLRVLNREAVLFCSALENPVLKKVCFRKTILLYKNSCIISIFIYMKLHIHMILNKPPEIILKN